VAQRQCKEPAWHRKSLWRPRLRFFRERRSRLALGLAAAALAGSLLGCGRSPATRVVALRELETAAEVRTPILARGFLSDPTALHNLCQPLAPRLSLLVVSSSAEWERLARAVPISGSCPDFGRGCVTGLICTSGASLDGAPPVALEGVRLARGAGLLLAEFHAGNYHPDGVTYLEAAYVAGLRAVLVVDVSGRRYLPEARAPRAATAARPQAPIYPSRPVNGL